MQHLPPRRLLAASLAVVALAVAACGSDDATDGTSERTDPVGTPGGTVATTSPGTTPATDTVATGGTTAPSVDDGDGVTAEGITDERCAENRAAGKITYLSSFDFSASAAIVDVIVAEAKGYFDVMCLDVELKAGFSTSNYPLIAANQAQFSSAGNYTEILNYSVDGASYVALVDYGKTPIEGLVTKDPAITDLAQLEGKTIGIKGDIPPSLVAMLASAGLERGTDYEEVLLDGFDPVAHLEGPIDAVPVYKSNEPGQLDAAGIDYGLFDPAELDIPGSFGILYTSREFYEEHPSAVADFIRAALKGMEDALADPPAAIAASLEQITAAGNAFFLTEEGETYRWTQESKEVLRGNPDGMVGAIDGDLLEAEVAAYTEAGVFAEAPSTEGTYDADLARSLYDADGTVIWPAGAG